MGCTERKLALITSFSHNPLPVQSLDERHQINAAWPLI